jgi:octaprenyl-diphosphate synthase
MSGAVAPDQRTSRKVTLSGIVAPVRAKLERVLPAMQDMVSHELPMIGAVSNHALGRTGKLFRPTLAILASEVDGKGEDDVVYLAAGIELMHLATLVHDDSVDHSAVRRGMPTVNAMFSHQVAVIMGDFLYSRALHALTKLDNLDVLKVMTYVSSELAVGEMRQIDATDALNFSEDNYVRLVSSKTGSLLSAACETGSLFGAARHRKALARYGELLGISFQIADDILDYTEDESTMGKPSGIDLKEHKVTLPLIGALPHLSKAARERVDVLFREDVPSDTLVREVVGIVTEAGGVEYARERGAHFAEEAHRTLDGLPDSPVRASLADAIVYVMERRS